MTWEQHHEAGRRRFAEGDAAGAEQAFRAAIAEAERTGGDPLQRASSLSSLGQLKYQQKDYQGAEECFRQSLELREAALGSDHPTVISGINNLAALFVARGALDEAEPLLQRAMAVTVKRVEATQAELAVNLNNLVRLYVKRGDYSRAEPLVVRLLALKRPMGPEHPDVAAVLVTLAKLRQSMGQSEAAERLWRRVLAVRQRTLAPNDPLLASTLDGLADSCAAQGKTEQELSLRERSLAVRTASLGADNPSLEAHRARIAALRQAIPAGRAGTPTGADATASTINGAASRLGDVSGLTGVIPNVIPEALAVTRAMQEQAAATAPLRAEPPTGARGVTGAPSSGPMSSARAPAILPAPAPDKTEPSPAPAAQDPAGDTAAALAAASEGFEAADATARISASMPRAPDGVKWVEPASVVPLQPRERPSVEMTKPKLKMATHARSSASQSNRAVPLVAALVLACAAVAAWYGRHHWLGAAVPTATHPVHRSPHQPLAPDTAGLAPGEPAAAPAADQEAGGSGTSGASLTSGPASTETQTSGTDVAPQTPQEPPPATTAPVRMSPMPEHSAAKIVPPAHRRVSAHVADDSVATVPSINLDAATRSIDSTAKARHSPATTP
jgi:tetratricopeptide (TPR) repeat protein